MMNVKTRFKTKVWSNYGDSYRQLVKLGLPVLVTQLGIIVVSFADTMMVGSYGTPELAAAAFVNSLFLIPIVMQIGFAQGLTPLVGALFSRGESRHAGRTMRGALQMNIAVSAFFTLLMGGMYFFLDRFGQPVELLPLIRSYYLIVLFSLLPLSLFNVLQQTCNGITDTATPMWFILGQNALNILGNWLLIFGAGGFPELGLTGAGLSTLFARVVSVVAFIFVFLRAKRYRPYLEGSRDGSRLGELRRKVWITSYPVMAQSGIECAMWSLGATVCGWFGAIQLAGYQIVTTLSQLGFMTYISFGTAVSVLVANHTGIGDMLGVRKTTSAGLHLNLILAVIASAIFYFGGHGLLRAFTPDEEVIASGMTLLLPLVLYQFFDAIQLTYCNAIRGTSRVKPLLWISITCYIVLGVPVLLLFAKVLDLGNLGVYYSFDAALFAASIMASLIFYRTLRSLRS